MVNVFPYNDDTGRREGARAVGQSLAFGGADVFQPAVDADLVRSDDVELVDREEAAGLNLLVLPQLRQPQQSRKPQLSNHTRENLPAWL